MAICIRTGLPATRLQALDPIGTGRRPVPAILRGQQRLLAVARGTSHRVLSDAGRRATVLWPTDTTGLSLSSPTIAEVLKPAGYATMCTGKWHVGSAPQFMPRSRGFDHYYGIPYSSDMVPSILIQDGTVIESPVQLDTLTQQYTQQSVNFIANNKSNPFFLYVAYNFPHLPLAASPAFLGKSPMGLYGDAVQELDWSVGQILQALKDNGIDDNTMVMFTSDHGPWYQGSVGRLRGRKWSTYEERESGYRSSRVFRGKFPIQAAARAAATQAWAV